MEPIDAMLGDAPVSARAFAPTTGPGGRVVIDIDGELALEMSAAAARRLMYQLSCAHVAALEREHAATVRRFVHA